MKKTLIFGGSFNPITIGHIRLIEKLKKQYDEIWIVPCYGHNFNKQMISFEHRFNMCSLLNDDKIKTIDIEKQFKIKTTYDLFVKLFDLYPQNKFSCLIGLDNANCIEQWYNYKDLLEKVNFVVFNRTGVNLECEWFKQKPHKFIRQDVGDISSTMIRQMFENNYLDSSQKHYLNENVYNYIISNGLYHKGK